MQGQNPPHDPPQDRQGGANSELGGNHFDFVNWFYWAIWWQQCSYINPHYLTGFDIQPGVVPNQLAANTTWPRDGHQNVPNPLAGIGIQIRIISGYETVVAPLWKRLMAEIIDMFLFGILLKFYVPDFEYRIPEVILESNDVWNDLDHEDLVEIRRLMLHFLVSTAIQRFTHAMFETIFLYMCGWTPGKWLMGLRVMKCTSSHLTRTIPGSSIRIEPGGKVSFIQAMLRSLFKGTVSVFIPLIVFFFNIPHGRTRYDKLFSSIVVDISTLNRPLFIGGPGLNHTVNFNLNQDGRARGAQVHLQVR